jgi:hypothetical protein
VCVAVCLAVSAVCGLGCGKRCCSLHYKQKVYKGGFRGG